MIKEKYKTVYSAAISQLVQAVCKTSKVNEVVWQKASVVQCAFYLYSALFITGIVQVNTQYNIYTLHYLLQGKCG